MLNTHNDGLCGNSVGIVQEVKADGLSKDNQCEEMDNMSIYQLGSL